MITQRFLPILNLVGCALVTSVIVAQWFKERGLDVRIETLGKQLHVARDQKAESEKRVTALESDVVQLKEAIEASTEARQEAEVAASRIAAEHNEKMRQFATAGEDQVKTWETAVAERDDKIRALNTSLVFTRERLNEAIARLKEAGAR